MEKENYAKYIRDNELDKLVDFDKYKTYEAGADSVSGKFRMAWPPIVDDLIRLHKLIRKRKSFTVLEFGTGYSTVVMADALKKNQDDWNNLKNTPEIRNQHLFKLFSVDASKQWIEKTKKRIPKHLIKNVQFQHSDVQAGTFNGQLCHFYKNIPDVVPDFIYLDGPHPKDVKGKINGLSFACDERTVMSGDLLLMEPTFLPGTFIVVDGRTNNTRFLMNNFKRKYDVNWDKKGDVTTLELNEERLGKFNLLGKDFFK